MHRQRFFIAFGVTGFLLVTLLMTWPGREAARAQGPLGTLIPPGLSTLMPTGIMATGIPTGAATMIPKTPSGTSGAQSPTTSPLVTAPPSPQAMATAVPQATATMLPTSAPTQAPTRATAPASKSPAGLCPSGALLTVLALGGVIITRWSLGR